VRNTFVVSVFCLSILTVLSACGRSEKHENAKPSSEEGPSLSLVEGVCRDMTSETKALYYEPNLGGQPRFEYASAETSGTSLDNASNTAIVKAVCHVKFSGLSGQPISMQGGGGFMRWIQYRSAFQDGQVLTFNVEMHFRRFNTGWNLESAN